MQCDDQWPHWLLESMQSTLIIREWCTLCACNTKWRSLLPQAIDWARTYRLPGERKLSSHWSPAQLNEIGMLKCDTHFVASVNDEILIHELAACQSLFSISISFGFFRMSDRVRHILSDTKFSAAERRRLQIVACARVNSSVTFEADASILSCTALCVIDEPRAVAFASFRVRNQFYDLAGFCTHLSSLVVAPDLATLAPYAKEDDFPDATSPDFASVSYDCPRNYFRRLNDTLDDWSHAYVHQRRKRDSRHSMRK